MHKRRHFLKTLVGAGASLSFTTLAQREQEEQLAESLQQLQALPIEQAVQQEELWKRVQEAYLVSRSTLNLNNGGVSPQPRIVRAAEEKYQAIVNEIPSLQLARVLPYNRPILKEKLARLAGCQANEIALMQNTTEGLQTVMMGIDWKAGDEVVLSEHDYSTVKAGYEQLSKRYGIVLKWVTLPAPIEEDTAIVEAYTAQFTSKTRLVHLTHLVSWTGQVLPVEAIARITKTARAKGIFSLVDGAHSFAHLAFKIEALGCDAFATSLHKWLSAPIGTGFLYVRQAQIPNLWSLLPSREADKAFIHKFEHKGTIQLAREEATHIAIDFQDRIGIALKEARLRYLKDYWAKPFEQEEQLRFFTSFKARYAGGLALFDLPKGDYKALSIVLSSQHRIHHTNSIAKNIQGLRITPNVYTSTKDLDRLVEAIQGYLRQ
ncbi:MAG: aminotransferase class V-fold PLP-dependent enzyme [Aureispira sp.]